MARFNLNAFFALDAILRANTLTEAARNIHLSQPAMSLALKRLRGFFNDELVSYDRGHAEYTPLAIELRPRVAAILEASQEALALSRAFDPATDRRTFTIAAPEAILFFFLPRLTAALAVKAPGITLKAVVNPALEPATRIDLSIVPEHLADPKLPRLRLFTEFFSCLISAHSGLYPGGMSEALYLSRSHVALEGAAELTLWPEGSPARRLLQQRNIVARAHSLNALPHLVVNGDLTATTTSRFSQHHGAMSPLLQSVSAPEIFEPLTFVAQTSAHRWTEPAIRWLMKQVELEAAP